MAKRTYADLRGRYGDWSDLLDEEPGELQAILEPAGLSRKRTEQFMGIARKLADDFGEVTLAPLASWDDDDAESYLCQLPGVSTKVAKCVLLYGFDRQVLPVDAHVHRITRRLGWQAKSRPDQAHEILEDRVPPDVRYSIHVNCVAHGRSICRPNDPNCTECPLNDNCEHVARNDIEVDSDAR